MAEQAAEYREKFLETLAEADDAIMEKYLDEGEFTVEELEVVARYLDAVLDTRPN